MPFATRADLLKLTKVDKLAQLAVPADLPMPEGEILRVALEGGDLNQFTEFDRDLITLAVSNIDQALTDATAAVVAYGITEVDANPLIKRMAAKVAFYMLADAQESVSDELRESYKDTIKQLQMHARGEINLTPKSTDAVIEGDVIEIASKPSRYVPIPDGAWADW
jgi:phage gp36-like protein